MSRTKVFYAFTDGSCSPNPGKGGWAWVFYLPLNDSTVIRFMDSGGKKYTTNNEMELTAMLECLRFLSKRDYPYKVIITSDSLTYVLKGMVKGGNGIVGEYPTGNLQNWKRDGWKYRANLPLWKQLYQECQRCYRDGVELDMRWVESHTGDEGNTLADTLANDARKNNK